MKLYIKEFYKENSSIFIEKTLSFWTISMIKCGQKYYYTDGQWAKKISANSLFGYKKALAQANEISKNCCIIK